MAVVYRASVEGPQGFARTLVIKRILKRHSQDSSFVRMLASEARLSALLRHPGIVQVHELGEVDGEYYIAMEYVEGHDLLSIMRATAQAGRRMPSALACYIVSELASALAYAHALTDESGRALEIVHRDISPSNIMIAASGAVKLVDFGVAKAAAHVRGEQTTTNGSIKGKLGYMSPEQADGIAIDRRSDIFALGIVFHECLTGKRLFRADSDLAVLRLIRDARVQPPSSVVADLDSELDTIVLKMLAADPAQRFEDCAQVASVLAPIVHRAHADASVLKRYVGELAPILRDHRSVSDTTPDVLFALNQKRARPSKRRLAVGLALGIVTLLLIAIGFAARTHPARPTPTQTRLAVAPAEPAPIVTTRPAIAAVAPVAPPIKQTKHLRKAPTAKRAADWRREESLHDPFAR